MDRLTERMEGEVYLHRGDEWGSRAEYQLQKDARERLAAYEETGLLPEEIADFQKNYRVMAARFADYKAAEIAGQLFILPCRVTDTVYVIETIHKGRKYAGGRVVSAQIDHVTIGGTTGKPVFDLCTETENWIYSLEPGEFFPTREAAEEALEEGRKNGEY